MHQLWIVLCFVLQGTNAFRIYNTVEGLCLEDSSSGVGVQLKPCQLNLASQWWTWEEGGFLANAGTLLCLSALNADPMRTVDCDGADDLQWQCPNRHLVSLSRDLKLVADGGKLTLSNGGKASKWMSLGGGDICQERPRSKRQSGAPGESQAQDVKDTDPHTEQAMTDEEEFLRWLYRTEDQTSWTFAMLFLSFIALLLGCVLGAISMMGNRNRKKIDQYRTVAATATIVIPELEEPQVIVKAKDTASTYPAPIQHSHEHSKLPVEGESETETLRPGDIMVTWKDGSVSNLYPNSPEEEDGEK